MKDGPLRAAVKCVACVMVGTGVHLRRLIWRLRGKRVYELRGGCQRSGMCCESPAIQVDRLTWYLPSARRAFLWWQRRVNGFDLVEADRRTKTFVFRCSHFDAQNRSCDSYATRPFMCRDYPRIILTEAWPDFFPQCGFRAVRRDAAARRALIEQRSDLSAEQKAELVRRLLLDG
jgi:hypothetical protein